MSWEGNQETKAVEKPVEEKANAPVETEKKPEEAVQAKVETKAESDAIAKDDKMVPQHKFGKVLTKVRERYKAKDSERQAEIDKLRQEVNSLKEGKNISEPDPQDEEINQKVKLAARSEFLRLEHVRGQKVYGQDYLDALELVQLQNDQALTNRIQWADSPVETLMEEADRIREETEYGSDPREREKKREQEIEARLRKKLEAEFAEKIKARGNQPTDVQSIRAAGGDAKPKPTRETWASGKGSLPR